MRPGSRPSRAGPRTLSTCRLTSRIGLGVQSRAGTYPLELMPRQVERAPAVVERLEGRRQRRPAVHADQRVRRAADRALEGHVAEQAAGARLLGRAADAG